MKIFSGVYVARGVSLTTSLKNELEIHTIKNKWKGHIVWKKIHKLFTNNALDLKASQGIY